MARAAGRVAVVSQTFIPDPASVGQHVADVALELGRRGMASGQYQVRVYASGRGYEDPSLIYPRREVLSGVEIRRFAYASFGKKNLLLRVAGMALFHVQAFFAVLFTPKLAGILFSTSPPLIGLPLCVVAMIRRVPVVYWAMDLNPDQLIALGKLQPRGAVARLLEAANRFILRRAKLIIALDRFMVGRLGERGIARDKILVLPPWSHEEHIRSNDNQTHSTNAPALCENPFRRRHNLEGKFVIMYSGNHSPSNPLTTLLDAAVRLKEQPNLRFLFVGGGLGKREVERYVSQHNLPNVLSLPYQPISELRHSLSAADVHVVSLGASMVGIIHPCKIYGAMSAGRPILFFGPRPSHVSDLLEAYPLGQHVQHGEVEQAVAAINAFATMPAWQLKQMGETARRVLDESLSQSRLCGGFCDAVEGAMDL